MRFPNPVPPKPRLSRIASLTAGLVLIVAFAQAQEPAFNVTRIGEWDEAGQSFADVWGEGGFAYIAHNGQQTISIIDITTPDSPVLATRYVTGVSSSAQDVKVHDGLMFVGMEASVLGCQIVDVRDPYNPVKLTDVDVMNSVHNVFYDQGWLYLVDSSSTTIQIVDLRTYDPDNPPAVIDTPTWTLNNVGTALVHDITVQDGRLYASAWDTLEVYDVSNIATEAPTHLGSTPGDNVHAAWATEDGRFVVTGEEHSVGGLALYEIFDNGSSIDLEVRDYFFVSGLQAGSAHNVLIDGYRAYVSYYAAGVQVLEIDPVTADWFLVASFDTTPDDGSDSTFAGCWGVYPFLSEDRVLASDRALGLSVLDVEPHALDFRTPNLPKQVDPAGSPFEIGIKAVGSSVAAGTVQAQISVDGGAAASQTLVHQGGGIYQGTSPVTACGSELEVSFTAENGLGTLFTAPGGLVRMDAAPGVQTVFQDDFSSDFGWMVDNSQVSDGGWERGDPIGTGAQPEFDATGALDGDCFFTKQGVPSGSISADDVDGGPAILISPTFDLSAGNGVVSYDFWLFNDDENDALVVQISIDGSTWIEARRHEKSQGGWQKASFRAEDFVAPSDQTQIRFLIADNPNNSVTEAAVDSVDIYTLACSNLIFQDGFESGDTSAWAQ